jgi:hypothetical protein
VEWVIASLLFVNIILTAYLIAGMFKLAVTLDDYLKKIDKAGILKIDEYMEKQDKQNKLVSNALLKVTQLL